MAFCFFDSLGFIARVLDLEVWGRAHVRKPWKDGSVRIMPACIGQASYQILLEALNEKPRRDVRFHDHGWHIELSSRLWSHVVRSLQRRLVAQEQGTETLEEDLLAHDIGIGSNEAGHRPVSSAVRALAQGICSELRKLVERSVEKDLLNKIVLRHRRGIQTDDRLRAIQGIGLEDCRLIHELMTKYNCYEHSQSTEIPMLIPEAPEPRKDLEGLVAWREQLTKRRNASA